METYIFNNKLYTKEDLENVAKRKNYTFEELLQKNPSIKLLQGAPNPSLAWSTNPMIVKREAGGDATVNCVMSNHDQPIATTMTRDESVVEASVVVPPDVPLPGLDSITLQDSRPCVQCRSPLLSHQKRGTNDSARANHKGRFANHQRPEEEAKSKEQKSQK